MELLERTSVELTKYKEKAFEKSVSIHSSLQSTSFIYQLPQLDCRRPSSITCVPKKFRNHFLWIICWKINFRDFVHIVCYGCQQTNPKNIENVQSSRKAILLDQNQSVGRNWSLGKTFYIC